MRQEYDFGVDTWTVGVLAFECLVGKAPFYAEQEGKTFERIKRDGIDYSNLYSAILRSNKLRILVGQILRSNHLYNYTNNDELLTITENTIKMAFRCLSKSYIRR